MFTIIIIIIILVLVFGSSNNSSSSNQITTPSSQISSNSIQSKTSTMQSSSNSTAVEVDKAFKTCPHCREKNFLKNITNMSICNKCGGFLSRDFLKVNLAGTTYDGRQVIISKMRTSDKIQIRRDKYNEHDKNAIAVYNNQNQNIGWIPRDIAATLAPSMDSGFKYLIEIQKIVGGNGYNFGLEVLIRKDEKKTKSRQAENSIAKPVKTITGNNYSRVSDNSPRNQTEYMYIDSVLARVADQESLKEVNSVIADFIKYRDKTLPFLNRENIEHLVMADLEALFDNTIMLAAGTESNFIHKHYKTILIQLAFQLGFLTQRLLPESSYAHYTKTKMSWLSTMDVRLETKILQPFFNRSVKVIGDAPIIADTTVSDQVHFWDIDEIAYVLSNLTELGFEFKQFIEKY